VPHVVGVRTAAGDVVRADLVVDAMGRRSVVPRLLEAAGARPCYEEAEDCGFMYFTRYFQRRAGGPRPATPFVSAVGSFSILTLPSDRDTWSLTVFASSHDRPLTRLRHTDRWTAVVAACPQYADALDGEPLTDVLPMSGVIDRYRRLTVEGTPVSTGIALVADAWACTNPSVGRGITLGLMHAARLREVVRTELGKPAVFADAWDAATESDLTPWYRFTVQGDRARLAQIDALREGREVEVPADPRSTLVRSMFVAMRYDADVYRAVTEVGSCQALPQEVFDRPGMVDRIMAVALGREAPPAAPGPTRAELLALLS
jgi:2-polyprenyl-6-methoxyphenol hydroxylase-like FAD-dependent oxidoreductase